MILAIRSDTKLVVPIGAQLDTAMQVVAGAMETSFNEQAKWETLENPKRFGGLAV